MADTGAPVHTWARRLGTNPISLQRRLYRHNKHELAQMLQPVLFEEISA